MSPHRRPGLAIVTRAASRTLYVRGTVRGRRVFESTGTCDPVLAEEYRAAREAELYRAAVHRLPERVTFAAATLSYMKAEERTPETRSRLAKLIRHFGPKIGCAEIGQAEVDKAAEALLRSGGKPATKLREIVTPLRAILQHAARRGWCAVPVFETIAASPARTDWLTPAEAEKLIAHAGHAGPLLTFLFCTGARMSEATSLQWRDVDLVHARALLRDTKNGRDRILDLPPRAVTELANLAPIKARDGTILPRHGSVFRTHLGSEYTERRSKRTGVSYGGQIKTVWARALRDAGIGKEVTPHHARHSWASWHYALHRDLLLLKQDGCWSSVSQVERYAKLVPEGMHPLISAFMGYRTGAGSVHAERLRSL